MDQVKKKSTAFVNPRRSLFPLVWSYLTNLFYTALIFNFINVMIDICVLRIHISPIILGCTIAITPLLVLLFRTIEVKDSKPKHQKIWLQKLSDRIVDWYRENIKNHWVAKLIWDLVLVLIFAMISIVTISSLNTGVNVLSISYVLLGILIITIKKNYEAHTADQYNKKQAQVDIIKYYPPIRKYRANILLETTNIVIPHGVTSIEKEAFKYYKNLTSITIPEGVTSIGSWAFLGCSSLTSITIPDSVTTIGGGTFQGCTSLTSITIPDSVTTIGGGAFQGCTSLTSITIPDSVTSIEKDAFYGCSSLTSITMPDRVINIEKCAFDGCSSLISITIPDSVTSIGIWAFFDCSNLTSITIPDSVTTIRKHAFVGCCKMHFAIIPTNLESKNELYWTSIGINLQQTTLVTQNKLSTWASNQKLSSTYTYRELAVLYQLQKDDNFTPTWPELGKLAPNLLMDDLLIVLPSEKRHIVLPRTYTTQPNSVCLEDHSLFSVVPVGHRQEELRAYDNPDDPTQTIQLQEVSPAASSAILRWLTLKEMATYLSAKASSRLKPIHPLTTQQARPVLQG